jgi:lipopolysaccharide transport system permease protein
LPKPSEGTAAIMTSDRTLTEYMRLARYLVRMEFARRFAGSIGGRIWIFFAPLLTVLAIWLAIDLGLGLSGRLGGSYAGRLIVGLSAWLFFAEAVNTSIGTITSNPHLVKKIIFPVELLPLSAVATALTVHLFVLSVVAIQALFFGGGWSFRILTLPLWIAGMLVLAMGLAVMLAALNVVLRDIAAIAPNAVSLLFWLTPVIWPSAQLPVGWQTVLAFNPVSVLIDGYRYALLSAEYAPDLSRLLVCGAMIGMVTAASILTFKATRPMFGDHL